MDFTALLSLVRLEVLVGMAGFVTIVTQLIREIPIEWTTERGKQIAFMLSAVLVGYVGYQEGADISVMLPIVPVVAWLSMGIYDTLKKAYIWVRASL